MKLVFGKTPWIFSTKYLIKTCPLCPIAQVLKHSNHAHPFQCEHVNGKIKYPHNIGWFISSFMYHDYFMVMLKISPNLAWTFLKKNPWAPIWLVPILEVFFTMFLHLVKTLEETSYTWTWSPNMVLKAPTWNLDITFPLYSCK